MPTQKQKAVLKKLSENVGKPVGQAMREAGYSESTSKTPKRLTERIGWQELMDRYIPDDLLARIHRELFDNKDWRARDAALDKAYRLKGKYPPQRLIREPDPYDDWTDEELDAEIKRKEDELRKRLGKQPAIIS